ncbi:MAG TPA: shikimate kinase [Bryobacteraceae bacterium]|jgi:shikimate kinase|nr:shikimate kinase [Bryobacteraceae bacterium]
MILKLKRTPALYLVGFMGCGKSTVGRILAGELGWKFVDLDEEIERREKTSIAELFDQRGEAAFREIESDALRERVHQAQMGRPQVVALGGGAFLSEENFELVTNNGVTVWLDCPLDRIRQRINGQTQRPLARDAEMLEKLFEKRRAAYARADYRVEVVDDDPAAAVKSVLALPLFK